MNFNNCSNICNFKCRHHNHVLDTTSIIRFSGLPNNAQLEMTAAQKIREETAVVVGLQLESGDRLLGNFIPTGKNYKSYSYFTLVI